MKCKSHLFAAAVIGLGIWTSVALAQAPAAPTGRGGFALRRLQHCLANLNLSSDVQASIQAIVTAGQPTIQADAQSLKADRQKIRADITADADKCAIGQDALTTHADGQKLKTDAQAIRDQILSKLTTDQQNQLKGCWQASGHRFGRKSWGSGTSSSGSSSGSS